VEAPHVPYHQSIIYEAHVKGLTATNPALPEEFRGTYAGIAHEVTINYLKSLGITALELMPVHHFINDHHLVEQGLSNYWGYNTIGFFAPDSRYSSSGIAGEQVIEFKDMVKALHRAGIEVILDVVYNHTAEGNHLGPTLSFKGIDNTEYYRLTEDGRYYMDFTGTGNTLNAHYPTVLRLMMDSLRYWVLEMHVDGFRFDLASTLARGLDEVNMWRGENSMLNEFALRFAGSPDLYQDDNRTPIASINLITAHDGFTLNDLVSYNEKHNEANGEDNKDGEDYNRSCNYGVEGPTVDPQIVQIRQRQQRNMLVSLMLSQGVPMLVAGDELGRTQQGNNNAYCQDNEISWLNWEAVDHELLAFAKKVIMIRKTNPVFSRRKWFQGESIKGSGIKDINWFLPDGMEMEDHNWNEDYAKSLGVFLNGDAIRGASEIGERIIGDSFYIIFNAHHQQLSYTLPAQNYGKQWQLILNTTNETPLENTRFSAKETFEVPGRSVIVLSCSLRTGDIPSINY
ncbi:MAG: glycogen debranching enzyme GlgX, partial [Pedobacter sp.]